MAFVTAIISSSTPRVSELEAALDAAAWANARWYAQEKAAGKEPPCCLSCAGVCYSPDRASSLGATFYTGAELLARGFASCGEVAAYSLGVERAKRGARVGRIVLVWQRPEVLHALVQVDGSSVRLDPSRELEPCGATSNG